MSLFRGVLTRLTASRAERAETKRVAEQRKLVGRVVRALPNACKCGRKRRELAEFWRLTDIVIDDTDYHAVPLGEEADWADEYEYICPNGFELVEDIQ